MKTRLVIKESTASLVVEAENEFELKMLEHVEALEASPTIQISTEQNWGMTVKGSIAINFNTAAQSA